MTGGTSGGVTGSFLGYTETTLMTSTVVPSSVSVVVVIGMVM